VSHKPYQAYVYLQTCLIVDSRCTSIRPKFAHSLDLRHVITISPRTIPSFSPPLTFHLTKYICFRMFHVLMGIGQNKQFP
jgi:hypothetical protein